MLDFRNKMREKMALLRMDEGFAARYVNEGFSGGEKKRLEMLQMAMLEPEIAILDETDSGLDIDALRIVAEGVNAMLNPDLGVLLITHYQRLLNYITPDFVHVLAQGRIVKSGGKDLALRLEDEGYGPILREAGLDTTCPTRRSSCPRRPPAPTADRARGGRPLAGRSTDGDRRPSRCVAGAAHRPAGFDPRRRPPRLPDPRPADPRPPARLPRLGVDLAEAAGRHRRDRHLLPRVQRERPSRDLHDRREGDGRVRAARAKVARFINAPDAHEIVFTRNATEAINLVAYSWGRKNINRGDAIVLTEMEHHANLVPWQLLVQERDGDLEFIPITDDGILRLEVFEVLLQLKPKLVAFTHVSNTLGTINPVREMVEMAHAAGALVLVDGAQAVPHVPVDVQALGADFYAFSGHKMLGADGLRRAVGAARAARGDAAVPRRRRDDPRGPPPAVRLQRHPVEVRGGHAGRRATRSGSGVAAEYLDGARDGRTSASTSASSSTYALDVLPRERARRSSCTARWTAELRGGVVPFNLPGIHPHDVAQVLDRFGIAVRAGHHCTMPLHERLDLAATARASFSVYSTRGRHRRPGRGPARGRKLFGVEATASDDRGPA